MPHKKNILFAWELGEGFGHLSKSIPLIKELSKRGYSITYVARELHALPALQDLDIHYLQAPTNAPARLIRRTYNFSEILINAGLGLHKEYALRISAWRHLIGLIKPSYIIGDYAPTALLSAHLCKIPAATFGSGFFVPPKASPYPNMMFWENREADQLVSSDHEATEKINEALSLLRAEPITSIHDIYDSVPRYIASFRELDHYAREEERFYGPLFLSVGKSAPVWPGLHRKKIFIYLTGHPLLITKILRTLSRIPADCIALLRNVPENAIPKNLPPHIQLLAAPINADQAIKECDVVINHSSMAMVSASLLAGTPMLLAPRYLEQVILCRRVAQLGFCQEISVNDPEKKIAQIIMELLTNPSYKKAAQHFAENHADYSPTATAEHIVNDMETELFC